MCSSDLVIAVVELQDEKAQPSERARKRTARMSRSLQAANIPLLVWRNNALPSTAAARAAILPKPPAISAAAGPVTAKAAPALPVMAGPNPFDEMNRDSTQDEMIELLEPPPSTWFDDLDSDLAPLAKK